MPYILRMSNLLGTPRLPLNFSKHISPSVLLLRSGIIFKRQWSLTYVSIVLFRRKGGGESFLGRGPVMLPHSCTIFIHLSFPFNLDKGHCHIPPFNTPLCSRVTPYQRSSTPLSPHFNTLLFVFCLPQTIGSPLFLPPIRTFILLLCFLLRRCILNTFNS